jgi:kynurenine formamidase
MPVFPGMDAPVVERVFNIKEHHCNVTKLDILTHMGTHLDCSSHVIEDGFFTSNKDINFFLAEG